jgi:heme/copper-type cytochrome/quinol oxidase subunit 3
MSQHAPHSRGLPNLVVSAPEWAPEVDARVTRVGMRIFIGADVMVFVAFLFAFFYLKALNNNHDWMPKGDIHPRRYIGGIIVVLLILCAGLVVLGARTVASTPARSRLIFWVALVSGLAVVVLQVYEFKHLGFDPQLGGAYPSVFVGLKGALLVQIVGALFWVGTLIHQTSPTGDSVARPASAVAFSYFMIFLAAISLVAYLVLFFLP